MKVWLDDIRKAPDGWVHAYTVEALKLLFETNKVEEISLDHDLGEGLETGYDFLLWLEAQAYIGKWKKIPEIRIHSANPVGVQNMKAALAGIKRIINQNVSEHS